MVITLMDENFNVVAIVENYESFIWTDRFNDAGDFEYYSAMDESMFRLFKQNKYLGNSESEHIMIIEGIEVESNNEDGDHLRVTGRSLESILDRRIVWGMMTVSGSTHNNIKKIINAAFVNGAVARRIPGFIFQDSTDPRVLQKRIIETAQYTGDVILDLVKTLCENAELGFKLILNEQKQFVFSLYLGTDRTNNQNEVEVVVFSPNFDNIIESDYKEDDTTRKNVALVTGEGEGEERIQITIGSSKGLDRREMYVDGGSVSQNTDEGKIDEATYRKQLKEYGKEQLGLAKVTKEFDGKVETTGLFQYGRDFILGDRVTFEDPYGNNASVRIDELIFSDDSEGYLCYPTFNIVTVNEYEDEE